MTYLREPIKMSGVLRGGGITTSCNVSAVRVSLEGTRLSKNCGYSIEWISKALPDGDYKLSVDAKTIDMRYFRGGWQVIEVFL